MPTFKPVKQRKPPKPVLHNIRLEVTPEKLDKLRFIADRSNISLMLLVKQMVDFALDNME